MASPAPLASLLVRPRFTDTFPASPADVRNRLLASLEKERPDLFALRPFQNFIGIHIADARRRYWSPRLFLSLEAEPEGGTRIEGVYGPEIEVWSVFLYGYLISGTLGCISAVFGWAQWFTESTPYGLVVTAAMAALAVGLYAAAQFGQKLAAWQTAQLHQAYQRAAAALGADPVES